MRRSVQVFSLITFLIAGIAGAQKQVVDPCLTESLPINTGYSGTGTLPVGAGDPNWEVIADPDPGTSEPRPAFVISPNGAWKPALPNSMWVSSYPGSANTTNGLYVFQYCFCLTDRFAAPVLNLSLRADDWAEVLLNGTSIGSTPNPSFNTAAPTTIVPPPASLFHSGRNCITVNLHNTGSVAMGLDLVGSIAANGLSVQKPACCNPTGQIQGRKWNDANGNGIVDTGEVGLAGWTISLSNGMTTTTDAFGYYNFSGVPPGPLTISEAQQTGWQQTFPTSGTYAVTVAPNSVITGQDFGNRKGTDIPPCSLCGDFNNSCCLGRDAQGNTIYSFLLTINYQPLTTSGACPLTLTPAAGTVLAYSPQVLVPGTNTISGTISVSGTPPSPFCFKASCGAGGESCVGAVCTKLLPPCDVKR
jgi:SdrD B-like domain